MARRLRLEQAYPGLEFRRRTRNWWARLVRVAAECVHLETQHDFMVTLIPDTLYLRGHAAPRRETLRPEVSLCRACLLGVLRSELAAYRGRVVAFEPDAEAFSQYFFVAPPDFAAAGLQEGVAAALAQRLAQQDRDCAECAQPATWLWLDREAVATLDDTARIAEAPGRHLCARHGAAALCGALKAMREANLFYMNVPYGEAGAYVWI